MTIKMKAEPSKYHWAEEGEWIEAKANYSLWTKTKGIYFKQKINIFHVNLVPKSACSRKISVCLV